MARGRGEIGNGNLSPRPRAWPGLAPPIHVFACLFKHKDVDARDKPGNDEPRKKAPAKPGPSISAHAADQISANRIRRSDAAPSGPGRAHPTKRGCGRTWPSSWSDRLRGNRARRARQAEWLPERE